MIRLQDLDGAIYSTPALSPTMRHVSVDHGGPQNPANYPFLGLADYNGPWVQPFPNLLVAIEPATMAATFHALVALPWLGWLATLPPLQWAIPPTPAASQLAAQPVPATPQPAAQPVAATSFTAASVLQATRTFTGHARGPPGAFKPPRRRRPPSTGEAGPSGTYTRPPYCPVPPPRLTNSGVEHDPEVLGGDYVDDDADDPSYEPGNPRDSNAKRKRPASG